MEKTPLFLIAFALLSFNSFSQEQYKKTDTKEIIRTGIKLNDEKKYAEASAEFKKVPRNDSNFILASIDIGYAQSDTMRASIGPGNRVAVAAGHKRSSIH